MNPAIHARNEWERCKPYIEAALNKGGDLYSIEDVYEAIVQGNARLWTGRKCAAVTQFVGRRNVNCNFWLLGGDWNELWDEIHPMVKHWAKEQGCKRLTGVFGQRRRGWLRFLKSYGYAPYWQALSMEL